MKTLYITDLDGTMLSSDGKLSEFSFNAIKKLIENGVCFSVATARTAATVLDMFGGTGLNTPIALMNGVCVYDTVKKKNVITHSIDKSIARRVIDVYSENKKHPMLYFDKGDFLEIIYTEIDNIHQHEYINDRNAKKLKKFVRAEKYDLNKADELLYIVSFDKPAELEVIYNKISLIDGITSCFYADNYTDCNFLETMNSSVSKGTAAKEIKRLTGADRIIAFGDNLNDIPLFSVADEAYAVENAHSELKKAATGVIASNDEDAVVRFISAHSGIKI